MPLTSRASRNRHASSHYLCNCKACRNMILSVWDNQRLGACVRRIAAILAALVASEIGAIAQLNEPPLLVGTDLPPGVVAPKNISGQIPFNYPPVAVRCSLTGSATLELLVTEQGAVADAKIVATTGYTSLDAAAIEIARQLRYQPATKDGVAITSRIKWMTNFQLVGHGPYSPCTLPPSAFTNGVPPSNNQN